MFKAVPQIIYKEGKLDKILVEEFSSNFPEMCFEKYTLFWLISPKLCSWFWCNEHEWVCVPGLEVTQRACLLVFRDGSRCKAFKHSRPALPELT